MKDLRFAWGIVRQRPFQVLIQVTNRCNMQCSFCDFWPNGVAPKLELSLDDYRALEKSLSSLGTFLVSIEGGEPFVRPDIIDIARILSARHVTVLYTNGWYIDAESARALFDAGVTQVGVSIDFPDALRHDRKRGPKGTFERATRALDLLRDAAPHGGKQVHVMSVVMEENQNDFEALLELSRAHGVRHQVTLLSRNGYRRKPEEAWPLSGLGARLSALRKRYPHFAAFDSYLTHVDTFLSQQNMPRCRAGAQSFNIDHVGNVSPCIEKIDRIQGNVREEPLEAIVARMRDLEEVRGCQSCWTLCRGFNQALGGGGTADGWITLGTRMRSA